MFAPGRRRLGAARAGRAARACGRRQLGRDRVVDLSRVAPLRLSRRPCELGPRGLKRRAHRGLQVRPLDRKRHAAELAQPCCSHARSSSNSPREGRSAMLAPEGTCSNHTSRARRCTPRAQATACGRCAMVRVDHPTAVDVECGVELVVDNVVRARCRAGPGSLAPRVRRYQPYGNPPLGGSRLGAVPGQRAAAPAATQPPGRYSTLHGP